MRHISDRLTLGGTREPDNSDIQEQLDRIERKIDVLFEALLESDLREMGQKIRDDAKQQRWTRE